MTLRPPCEAPSGGDSEFDGLVEDGKIREFLREAQTSEAADGIHGEPGGRTRQEVAQGGLLRRWPHGRQIIQLSNEQDDKKDVDSVGQRREGQTTPGSSPVLGTLPILGQGLVVCGVTPFRAQVEPKVLSFEIDLDVPPSRMMVPELLAEGSQVYWAQGDQHCLGHVELQPRDEGVFLKDGDQQRKGRLTVPEYNREIVCVRPDSGVRENVGGVSTKGPQRRRSREVIGGTLGGCR